jgi:hypothetical protein
MLANFRKMLTKNVCYTLKNVDEKMLTTLQKILTKNVRNILKNIDEKNIDISSKKLLIEKFKKAKLVGIWGT